jgi:RNA polymerase sigma-70 factor (ECF subfamily)
VSTQPRLDGQSPAGQAADSDFQLLQRIRQGEEHALLLLYDRHSQLVYSIIIRVLRDEGVAEEIMQDIFLQLWRQTKLYDPSRGTLKTWIAVVARHRAVDQLRKRRQEVDIDDFDLAVGAKQEENASCMLFLDKIQAEMCRMPESERLVLELAYFEGYTHSEISAKTGQPLGTVKSRIRAAVSRLRDVFVERAA